MTKHTVVFSESDGGRNNLLVVHVMMFVVLIQRYHPSHLACILVPSVVSSGPVRIDIAELRWNVLPKVLGTVVTHYCA